MSNVDRDYLSLDNVQTQQPQNNRPAEGEKKLGVSMLMKIALSVLVISSLVISISCLMQANQLNQEAEELNAEIESYKDKIEKLEYFLEEEVDEEYIAKYAREYLNMYYPDEEIYYHDVND